MNISRSTALLVLFSASLALAQQPGAPAAAPDGELKTTRSQASYAIGLNIARSLQSDGAEVDVRALMAGIADVFSGADPKLDEEQCRAALVEFSREIQAKQQAKMLAMAEKNKKEGEAFLAANKQKEGVKTLPSGLQYQVLKAGDGKQPTLQDVVTTHYHGTLIDGTVFDSSVEREQPATFQVGGVIRGWQEALQLMHVGDKWRLFVPSDLAYGPRGAGEDIGPNTVLIFDVELLGIQ